MIWTEAKPPTKGESHYDHITCETPLGRCIIEWKSWKYTPSYGVELNNEWIGSEDSLLGAKAIARSYLVHKYNELNDFLNI